MENEYQKFADEVFQKLDRIVKYNNLQTLREDKAFKALWFGDKLNLLWDVVKVQQVENKIMCYDSDEQLINIIFVSNEINVDLEFFDNAEIRIVIIPMLYNYEKMLEKLHNEKLRIFIATEDNVYPRMVKFPKTERM